VGIVTDKEDSPHLLVDKIQGELYYGFAETDGSVPDHVIPELMKRSTRPAPSTSWRCPPGSQHGYCFAERAVYHPQAGEQAWGRLFDFVGQEI